MPGHIPEPILDEIRTRADIVEVIGAYLPLKRRGSDYWSVCPFHREKTPSFKVSVERQAFYCFGCRKSGNVFTFVMERENVDFVGAVRLLAQRVGVRIPEAPVRAAPGAPARTESGSDRERLFTVLAAVRDWYRTQLREAAGEAARQYLVERGLEGEILETFQLGYAPDSWDATLRWGERHGYARDLLLAAGLVIRRDDDNGGERCYDRFRGRLMFPIWDELGRVVGFSARSLAAAEKTAKYINTPETALFRKGRILYGLHLARPAFKENGAALVCEGQLDVIACHRAGLQHALSPQGTAFTENHARLLKRFTDVVIVAFDADAAGESAALRSLEILHGTGLTARIVAMPKGEDPDSIFQRAGAEGLQAQMRAAGEAFPFVLEVARGRHDETTVRGKDAIAREVLGMVATLDSPVGRAAACQWLSREMRIPEQALYDLLNRTLQQRRRQRHGRQRRGEEGDAADAAAPVSEAVSGPAAVTSQAERMLLDLALHHGFVAHELVQDLTPELVSDGAVGRALNLVVALTGQGEWELAAREINADQELVANPDVARALVESDFAGCDTEHADRHVRRRMEDRLQRAKTDCLRQLQTARIEQRIREIRQELTGDPEPDAARTLRRQAFDLARQKDQLRRAPE